jgi:alkanesulfonate monooxygenase SsuD/methylene tetrahydromethanopterin reductase-like flavin-dependent oxidoreductase (luciferase family)
MLKIGVRLPRRFENAGEYLADARALDAAGVDSLWLGGDGYEPWLLLASIAAVTGQARLVAPVSAVDGRVPAAFDTRVATLAQLSRRRSLLNVTAAGDADGVEAMIGVARRAGHRVILEAAGREQVQTAARLADGMVSLDDSPEQLKASLALIRPAHDESVPAEPFEVWARIDMPADREAWRRVRQEFADAGATGVIVPADPRLLDLLRNADEDDDRSDLGLAQG